MGWIDLLNPSLKPTTFLFFYYLLRRLSFLEMVVQHSALPPITALHQRANKTQRYLPSAFDVFFFVPTGNMQKHHWTWAVGVPTPVLDEGSVVYEVAEVVSRIV